MTPGGRCRRYDFRILLVWLKQREANRRVWQPRAMYVHDNLSDHASHTMGSTKRDGKNEDSLTRENCRFSFQDTRLVSIRRASLTIGGY